MASTDPGVLSRRITELERRQRRLQVAVGLLVAAASGLAFAAQAPVRQKITAQQITLVDDANRTRASLEVPAAGEKGAGQPALTMFDESGRAVVRLRVDRASGVLEVIDAKGEIVRVPGQLTAHPLTNR